MQEYVLGVAHDTINVVFIEKKHPEWQKGLLNLPGGKVEEGETPEDAMSREFLEETGLYIETWEKFGKLNGQDYIVHLMHAHVPNVEDAKTTTDEEVFVVDIEEVDSFHFGYDYIHNVKLLLNFALNEYRSRGAKITITYP
jgi:8-oxo-dGTP diphosphatase